MITPVRPSLGHFPTVKQAIALRDISEDAPKRIGLFRRAYAGLSPFREAIKCVLCALDKRIRLLEE